MRLLFDKLIAEWAMTHSTHESIVERYKLLERRIEFLRKTLVGFATNGTDCKACQMSNQCASEALARDDLLTGESK